MKQATQKNLLRLLGVALVLGVLAYGGKAYWSNSGPGDGFVSGNGRIEAVEINIATKLPGRVEEVMVREGEFVSEGQVVARMSMDVLQAQRDEARAQLRQAESQVLAIRAQLAVRESETQAAEAVVLQRETELEAATRRLARTQALVRDGASSSQELDDDRAQMRSAQAAVAAAKAQVAAAQAGIESTKAQQVGADSVVQAAKATVNRVQADIDDSQLIAPRDGRVQFLVAQPGEVLGAGGRVLNMIDVTDVHMTFFLPETVAGRVALGQEARLVLDAAPNYVVPAKVSFVAANAQFTPKTVETASERQKLMFRVKAKIDPQLLRKYLEQVKVGLPGVAWIKLDEQAQWPVELSQLVSS